MEYILKWLEKSLSLLEVSLSAELNLKKGLKKGTYIVNGEKLTIENR